MKMKSTYLLLFVFLSSLQITNAQDLYRSVASGNWGNAATWEFSTDGGGSWNPAVSAPDASAGTITIRSDDTITVAAMQTANEIVIDYGGVLTISSDFTIADGTGIDLEVQLGGVLNIAAAFNISGVVNNNGVVHWSAGTINFNNGTLDNNGYFSITGNNNVTFTAATSNIINNNTGATINKSIATGNTDIKISLNNSGTINVTSGAININEVTGSAVVVNSGTINVTNNSTFSSVFGGITLNSGTSITGTGTVRFGGVDNLNIPLTLASTLTLELRGELKGSGSLIINGKLVWLSNFIRVPVTVTSGATFEINGTVGTTKTLNATLTQNGTATWYAGTVVFSTGSFLNNGILNISLSGSSDSLRRFASSTNSIVNAGIINKIDATPSVIDDTLTVSGVPVTNTGIIKGNGVMNFTGTGGGLTNNGTVTPGNSAGILTINPSAISSGSTVSIEILNSGGPGAGHDQLILAGNTNLTGSTLTVTDDPAAPLGVYTIMTTSTGTFSNTFGTVNKPVNFNNPVIGLNTITIEKVSATPLPVQWGDFFVKADNQKIKLTWTTVQEVNTSHFVIERSSNGSDFAPIGNLPAQGNSNFSKTYTFTDATPVNGKNFYRIKQVDIDAKYDYSVIRFLDLQVAGFVDIYPNPFANTLSVNVGSDNIKVIISDMTGKTVKSLKLSPGLHPIPVSDLKPGNYNAVIYQREMIIATKRIVKF